MRIVRAGEDYRKLIVDLEESTLPKIDANKIYEVTTPKSKYLLVESSNGFYKTSVLNDISKYKKINEVKAKKFIDDPSNMWKGIKVIDTMLQPRTIKLMENHDEKLQHAIDSFYNETGIKLERVHASKDKVFYHGIDKKNNFEVELELKIKDGGYELDTYGSNVLEFNPSEKPHKKEGTKNKFKLMTDLMYKHFGKL